MRFIYSFVDIKTLDCKYEERLQCPTNAECVLNFILQEMNYLKFVVNMMCMQIYLY